jgi:Kef-type K+ transport system membrane component KefB
VASHAFPLVAIILAIAAAAGLLAVRLRQPPIVAFISVGILVGPVGTSWVAADSTIELLDRMGIAILLFLVGLRLDLHLIRSTGPVALATGLGQVLFTSVFGYLIAIALGMDSVTALYVAVGLTFSSTIIIVKLLSDKRELDQLHGRIAVGFLIVQDIVVVLVMIALTAFGRPAGDNLTLGIILMLVKGLGLLAGIGLLTRYVLPRLLRDIARSQELLVLFGVAYAVSIAALSEWLGFSSEVGAFLAGVSLAPTAYRDAMGGRLVSLRDFLLLFFFLDLGAKPGVLQRRSADRRGRRLLRVRARRQPTDRPPDHGGPPLPGPRGLPRRSHGGADLRVLPHPRRARTQPRPHQQLHRQPDHRRRSGHHRWLDLSDHVLTPDLPAHPTLAHGVRTQPHPPHRAGR